MPIGPPGEFEANIDRIIREAVGAGDFDDLPGKGQPIPGAGNVDDEFWWIREWVKRNRLAERDRIDEVEPGGTEES